MSRKIPQLWAKKGGVTVSDVGFGFYVVNFETVADYERAMFGGPWMINDHYVVIQEWRPYFRPEETLLSTLRVWVRLPGIPFEYFDNTILKLIGDRIGRTVRIDHTTLEGTRGNFARICVEVDLSKPLLSKYRLRRRVRRIEYEGLHTICFNCGCYGHKDEACKQAPEEVATDNQTTSFANPNFQEALAADSRPEVEEDFGPWMQVKKSRRKPKPSVVAASSADPTAVVVGKGNSFAALENMEGRDEGKSRADSLPLININEAPIAEDFVDGDKENQIPNADPQILPVGIILDPITNVASGPSTNGPSANGPSANGPSANGPSSSHSQSTGIDVDVGLGVSLTPPFPDEPVVQKNLPLPFSGSVDHNEAKSSSLGSADAVAVEGSAKFPPGQSSTPPLKKSDFPVRGTKNGKTKAKDHSMPKFPKYRDQTVTLGARNGPSVMEE
ncbi:hypothetical protein LINPERPRIM_LOCUS39487 [Linum perenne]